MPPLQTLLSNFCNSLSGFRVMKDIMRRELHFFNRNLHHCWCFLSLKTATFKSCCTLLKNAIYIAKYTFQSIFSPFATNFTRFCTFQHVFGSCGQQYPNYTNRCKLCNCETVQSLAYESCSTSKKNLPYSFKLSPY